MCDGARPVSDCYVSICEMWQPRAACVCFTLRCTMPFCTRVASFLFYAVDLIFDVDTSGIRRHSQIILSYFANYLSVHREMSLISIAFRVI